MRRRGPESGGGRWLRVMGEVAGCWQAREAPAATAGYLPTVQMAPARPTRRASRTAFHGRSTNITWTQVGWNNTDNPRSQTTTCNTEYSRTAKHALCTIRHGRLAWAALPAPEPILPGATNQMSHRRRTHSAPADRLQMPAREKEPTSSGLFFINCLRRRYCQTTGLPST